MARLLGVFLALPLSAMAAEPTTTAVTPVLASSSDLSAQLGQMLLGLLLVIGLIFVLAWLLRRVQQVGPRGNRVIKLLASQALGPRERLVLVQVGNEQILLGLTPGRITPLHVLKEPVTLPTTPQPATPEFAKRLLELMGNQKDKP